MWKTLRRLQHLHFQSFFSNKKNTKSDEPLIVNLKNEAKTIRRLAYSKIFLGLFAWNELWGPEVPHRNGRKIKGNRIFTFFIVSRSENGVPGDLQEESMGTLLLGLDFGSSRRGTRGGTRGTQVGHPSDLRLIWTKKTRRKKMMSQTSQALFWTFAKVAPKMMFSRPWKSVFFNEEC